MFILLSSYYSLQKLCEQAKLLQTFMSADSPASSEESYQLRFSVNSQDLSPHPYFDTKHRKEKDSTSATCEKCGKCEKCKKGEKCENFDEMQLKQRSKKHFLEKNKTPIDFGIDLQSQSKIKYKVSVIKTVLRQFYKNVRKKKSENKVKSEWKQIMENQLKKYNQKCKKSRFKSNVASMDHLFCEGSRLPEGVIKQNRKLLIQLLKSESFQTKIKSSGHFNDHKRLTYLNEAKLISLKIQMNVKSFGERI